MKVVKVDPARPEKERIEEAVRFLKGGKIIAFPTDTVYGLAVNAEDKRAVDRLYWAKKRGQDKPFILFLTKKKDIPQFAQLITLPAQKLINRFWPGPLTLIFKADPSSPFRLVSQGGKIGIRLPSHPIPQKIIERSRLWLATTSANPSGEPSSLKAEEIGQSLRGRIDLLMDGGEVLLGEESTIVDVTSSPPHLIREGWLSREEVEKVWREKGKILFVCTGNTCRSPMAEGLFKKMWPGKRGEIEVYSAGTDASIGSKPTELALEVMREKGIDISSHRSIPLNKRIIEEADLVLTMENKHKEKVLDVFPYAEGKLFLLKEFALGMKEGILDPALGGSREIYRRCAREMEETLRGLIRKLG